MKWKIIGLRSFEILMLIFVGLSFDEFVFLLGFENTQWNHSFPANEGSFLSVLFHLVLFLEIHSLEGLFIRLIDLHVFEDGVQILRASAKKVLLSLCNVFFSHLNSFIRTWNILVPFFETYTDVRTISVHLIWILLCWAWPSSISEISMWRFGLIK